MENSLNNFRGRQHHVVLHLRWRKASTLRHEPDHAGELIKSTLGDEFKTNAHRYITNGLIKGIPSLFSDVKDLYTDSAKRTILDEIITSLEEEYKSSNSESPTNYLWALYYLAQHYSHLRQYEKALTTIEKAIEHTPTLPELYTCKARILKRAGDKFGAVRCVEEARRLDGQDRFLNTKSAKYCLRAELVDEASNILGLFTKVCSHYHYASHPGIPNEEFGMILIYICQKDAESPGADLEEMQSMLYLTEVGDAYNHLGKLGLALKKYLAIQKVC